MSDREKPDFDALNKILSDADDIAIFCHINPDGDCVGAMFALGRALVARGKKVTYCSYDKIPGFLDFVIAPGEKLIHKADAAALCARKFGLAVMVDCATKKRAGDDFIPALDSNTVISIDHHGTNGLFAAHNFIDADASSTCEVLFRFFKHAGWEYGKDVAECLYLGIMYDTGRFMHMNTTPLVFEICSALVAMGVSPSDVAGHVFRDREQARLRLLGYALVNMKTAADGKLAWVAIPRKAFDELGATDADTEGIVEELGAYRGCEVHIVFSEGPDGRSRASTRSAGRVRVDEICAMFGGGGHKFASGVRSEKPLDELERLIVDEALKRL